jgi:hypothetical protein
MVLRLSCLPVMLVNAHYVPVRRKSVAVISKIFTNSNIENTLRIKRLIL